MYYLIFTNRFKNFEIFQFECRVEVVRILHRESRSAGNRRAYTIDWSHSCTFYLHCNIPSYRIANFTTSPKKGAYQTKMEETKFIDNTLKQVTYAMDLSLFKEQRDSMIKKFYKGTMTSKTPFSTSLNSKPLLNMHYY